MKDKTAQIMMSDGGKNELETGMMVRLGKEEFPVSSVTYDAYDRAVAYAPVSVPDGRYEVKIVIERIHPIRFLFQ